MTIVRLVKKNPSNIYGLIVFNNFKVISICNKLIVDGYLSIKFYNTGMLLGLFCRHCRHCINGIVSKWVLVYARRLSRLDKVDFPYIKHTVFSIYDSKNATTKGKWLLHLSMIIA